MRSLDSIEYARLGDALVDMARDAGEAILEVYRRDDLGVASKADDSPVTEADLAAHEILVARLEALEPRIPILSEEGDQFDGPTRAGWDACWIVDPLDGTREFVNRNDEFTVNVALIEKGRPTLGVVGVPARGQAYLGRVADGIAEEIDLVTGASRPIRCRPCPEVPMIMASRSHRSEALESLIGDMKAHFPGLEEREAGSSLKFVEIARGACDAYPRVGPTSEWDIAAAEAVVIAAGGIVRVFGAGPVAYNKPDTVLNPFFWVAGEPEGPLSRWLGAREGYA